MPLLKDLIDTELEQIFAAFVAEGGLDATQVVNEAWERRQRQTAYCAHGFSKRECQMCPQKPKFTSER